jgi:hypothetical protein
MPKHKKIRKQCKARTYEDFDDMLAELRASDLAVPSSASSPLASSQVRPRVGGAQTGPSVSSSATEGPNVSEEAIVSSALVWQAV